jgi:hypothetical protein
MPFFAPTIIGPVTPCCDRIRVKNQFSGSTVRLYVEGDPTPVGSLTVPWSDFEIPVDRTRLVPGRKLSATQEKDGETGVRSPEGERIQPPAFGVVTFVRPPYVCGRSLLLSVEADPKHGAAAGSRIEIWQGSSLLGTGPTVGTLCRIDFAPNQHIVSGAPLQVVQFICTTGSPMTTTSDMPLNPPTAGTRNMSPVELLRTDSDVALLVECARLIKVRGIVPGAALRLLRGGVEIYNQPVPTDQQSVFVDDGFAPHEEISADQSMIFCQLGPGAPDRKSTDALTELKPPRIDGPLCPGPTKVTVSRLKPGATLILFADGVEIGRGEAPDVSVQVDLNVPSAPATITAQQQLCGHISPISRPYTAAVAGSGRWFLVEDARGNNLKADAFAVHAGLVHSREIVLFSGSQFNPDQAAPREIPPDVDHAQVFDCSSLSVKKIHAPGTDAFCCGHAFLPDGRLLIGGGTEEFVIPPGGEFHHDHFPGLPNAWTFEPFPSSGGKHWVETDKMHGGRWYPTLVTLSDGKVLALSGHTHKADTSRHNNHTMDVYEPASGTWQDIGNSNEVLATDRDFLYLYPRLHVLPGGDVFSSTPMPGLGMRPGRWTPGSGTTWRAVDVSPAGYAGFDTTAVLLPLLPEDGYRAAVAVAGDVDAYVIDFGTPASPVGSPTWKKLEPRSPASRNRKRLTCNAVILPTAEILIVGGVEDRDHDSTGVLDPEMLHREAGAWKWKAERLAPASVVRNYHSTALLMPDGRVWTAGGNVDAKPGWIKVRHREVEIYEPWYCCEERPRIFGWPSAARAAQRVLVRVWSRNPIARLALVRAGSATHAFNPDQRYVGLSEVRLESNDLYIGQVPSSDIAIPGYYLLFACTDRNVPSQGVFMQILP